MSDFNNYKHSLVEELGARDASEATWIKTPNPRAKAVIITFNGVTPPELISITGERALTKVRPYFPSPMKCNQCQEYGHTSKHCKGRRICGQCSEEGHSMEECSSEAVKCHHCQGNHRAGDKRCSYQMFEKEIIAVSVKENISKAQARRVLNNRNPDFNVKVNYAAAVSRNELSICSERSKGKQQVEKRDGTRDSRQRTSDIDENENRTCEMDRSKVITGENKGHVKQRELIQTQAVCVSLESGSLFTTTVLVPGNGATPTIQQRTPTSENNAEVREEVKKIYEEGKRKRIATEAEDDVQIDLDEYEAQLQSVYEEEKKKGKKFRRGRSDDSGSSNEPMRRSEETRRDSGLQPKGQDKTEIIRR